MSYKSRGHDIRICQDQGYGKAFDASRPKPSAVDEKFRKEGAGHSSNGGAGGADFPNSKLKVSEISFKPTSYGGFEGQKDLQTENVAEKLALLDDSCPKLLKKVAEFADQNNNVIENSVVKSSNISFKPISNGGRGEQNGKKKAGAHGASLLKELQLKKVAEKLALSSKKFDVLNSGKSGDISSNMTSNFSENAKSSIDDTNRIIQAESEVDSYKSKFSDNRGNEKALDDEQVRIKNDEIDKNMSSYVGSIFDLEVEKYNKNCAEAHDENQPGIFRENVEIFRKAFGDNHYLNQVRENVDIFQKARGKGKQIDQISRPAVDLISGAFFEEAKRGRQGFVSKEKFADQNNNVGSTNSSINVDAHRSKWSKFDQQIEAKRGFNSKDERQPIRRGTNQSKLPDDAQFRKNVEICRRAFSESHYVVRAGREGLSSKDDDEVGASSSIGGGAHRASSSAQRGKFSECVQKNNFSRPQFSECVQKDNLARPQGRRVADKFLPFAVYVEKLDISNSKVKLKLSNKEYLSIRTELINAFMRESQNTQVLLVNE